MGVGVLGVERCRQRDSLLLAHPPFGSLPLSLSISLSFSLAHAVNTRQGCFPTAPQRCCGTVAVQRTAGALFTNGQLPPGGLACQLGFESRVSAISDSTVCRSQQQRLLHCVPLEHICIHLQPLYENYCSEF